MSDGGDSGTSGSSAGTSGNLGSGGASDGTAGTSMSGAAAGLGGSAGSSGASAGGGTAGSSGASAGGGTAGASSGGTGASGGGGAGTGGIAGGAAGVGGSAGLSGGGSGGSGSAVSCGKSCPVNYSCETANGLPVCRAASGIPLFSNIYLIVMENTSLATLQAAMTGGAAPNLAKLASKYATGGNYHGVAHPSLPNYVAITSGGTQDIVCDCDPAPGLGACSTSPLTCELNFRAGTACSCPSAATNIADQIETAHLTWMDFGEDMGTPCNTIGSGSYAVQHNPFLYYSDILSNTARCSSHVVDFSEFNPASPATFNDLSPNLVDDMNNPVIVNSTNIPNGDAWIGPHVQSILTSAAYKTGGLVVVVWDEDDASGIVGTTDHPIPLFLMSPYAKGGGYVSPTAANHYSLLATFEDGLGLGRLGSAATATPLADFFPAN
ncbi:MAG TPA: alkaline phosphatase family protein [Polyangiaceae bacterium]|nr:alkaline phosphatase family protein [Polyangiaceae bacterium]